MEHLPSEIDAAPGTDLSGFGLDAPDEEWLRRVRRVEQAPALGRLADYELLEEISRGAQGVVYRARRDGQRGGVAVKRLLAGSFATGMARARFERELETAAALRHPQIVQVLDVLSCGSDPLLVMEWIDGVPVDRWSDARRDSAAALRGTLEVFWKVCAAVHYAHQRGVIHRDLKPSNILVDALNQPHLLDFGLAKTIEPAGGGPTITGSDDFLGTPAYASPEQVRGDHAAVDIRTDVYALGVVLFRLLTGELPFPSSKGLGGLLSDIQNTEAPRPSRLSCAVNDELDAIVGRAMAKDMERRYASVDALAADTRRYLAGEPVEAKRGRRRYEWRKTVERNKTAVFGLLAMLVLATGAAAALWAMYVRQGEYLAQVTRARDGEAKARQSAVQQQQVLEKLLSAAAEIGQGTDLAVRRFWLDEATRVVEAELVDDPTAAAAAHDAIGRTYQGLALYEEAEHHLREALGLRQAALPSAEHDVAVSLHHLGLLLQDRNRFSDAEPFLREALAMRERVYAEDNLEVAESLNAVGLVLQSRGEHEAAGQMHERALATYQRLLGEHHADAALTLDYLGNLELSRSRFAEAEPLFRRALDIHRAIFGDDHRETAGSKINLAKALFYLGRYDEAEPLFREAIAAYRRLLGNSHDNVAWGLHRLGILLHAKGQYAEAEDALRESLDIYRRCFGGQDHYVALVLNSLGTLLMDQGELQIAKAMFEESLAIQAVNHPSASPSEVWRQNRLAEWMERAGRGDAAESLLRQVLAAQSGTAGREYSYALRCSNSLARILLAKGRAEEAESLLRDSLGALRTRLGPEHPDVGHALMGLATALRSNGRLSEAKGLALEGVELQRSALGEHHPQVAQSLLEFADIAEAMGENEQAAECRRQASEICRRSGCAP